MKNISILSSSEENTKKNQIKRTLMCFLIGLTVMQQMPVINDLYYSQIRGILYLGFFLFTIHSLASVNKFWKIPLVRYFIMTILYMLLLSLAFISFRNNTAAPWQLAVDPFELLVPFGILICSLNTDFSKKQLSAVLLGYVLLAGLLGLASAFYYSSGYTIAQQYLVPSKNQIGPILGISTVIMGLWILNKKQLAVKYDYPLFKIGLFCLILASILVIRNRASLVGILLTLLIFFLAEYKTRITLKNFLAFQVGLIGLLLLFVFGGLDALANAVLNSMTLGYNVTDLNSLSAGRTDVYKSALQFSFQYPVLGDLGPAQFKYGNPHNYILNKWVDFGIIGSWPIVVFYLYLWFFVIRSILAASKNNMFSLPHWVLLFSLIVSLFEYTYPFGPGVSQIMLWFLLGQYLSAAKRASAEPA